MARARSGRTSVRDADGRPQGLGQFRPEKGHSALGPSRAEGAHHGTSLEYPRGGMSERRVEAIHKRASHWATAAVPLAVALGVIAVLANIEPTLSFWVAAGLGVV